MTEEQEHYTRDYLYMYGFDGCCWWVCPTLSTAFKESFFRDTKDFETRQQMRDYLAGVRHD